MTFETTCGGCRIDHLERLPVGDRSPAGAGEHRVVDPGAPGGRGRVAGPRRALAAAADVAVFPSLARETYGLVVDEALHMHLPVIVSNRGALGERIGGRGSAVSVDTPEALAATLRSILADPGILQRYAAAAAPVLETPSSHAARLVGIYQRAMKAPLPIVDIQSGLLRRIDRHRRRVHEITELLQRLRRG